MLGESHVGDSNVPTKLRSTKVVQTSLKMIMKKEISIVKWFAICTFALFGVSGMELAHGADAPVQLVKNGSAVQVKVGGKEFTVLNFGKEYQKPFFSPVRAPSGSIITRSLDNVADHPHHKGVWLSLDEVNGLNFWGEKAKIENTSVEIAVAEGNPVQMNVTNNWLGTDGNPILVEKTIVKIYSNRLISYDSRLTATVDKVTFEDTKEGMFGIRLRDGMREKEDGKVINSRGAKTTARCWGETAEWVDYYGPVDGKIAGVALFDHPNNFRPSRYHVRDYGLFTISPFGEHAYTKGMNAESPIALTKGKTLRLRYALYVHSGDERAGNVSRTYRQYLSLTD